MGEVPIVDVYLGDGVYASFDGWQIWLDTRGQFPHHRIALEPEVYNNLIRFANKIPGREHVQSI